MIEAELKIIILTGLLKQPDSKSGFPLYCVDFLTKQDCKIKKTNQTRLILNLVQFNCKTKASRKKTKTQLFDLIIS